MKFQRKTIVPRNRQDDNISSYSSVAGHLGSDLLGRIFRNREITDPAQLDFPLSKLMSPQGFKDAEAATDLLCCAVTDNKRIIILGDYDADGATATVLGIRALRDFGVKQISYLVPDRFRHGYGLSPEIAKDALEYDPDLIVTVDNGISSIAGVKYLKNNGKQVLITDHHLAGDQLPEADAILNPNQPGCHFPSKNLAGVGVMFYLLSMVRAKLQSDGWFKRKNIEYPALGKYLDLVALGTVADLVPLDYNNRILVSQGIKRIRANRCCPGITALLESAGRNISRLVSSDLGYVVAPRLNASGRLEHISTGIECLLMDDSAKAQEYAAKLNAINQERKEIEQKMQVQALEMVRSLPNFNEAGYLNNNDSLCGFCLFDQRWHQGVTGLVASRIKEQTGQPVIAFAKTVDGQLTGSGRSVSGLHIRDLLESISGRSPGLIIKFGGHAMAAGLTIEPDDFEDFAAAFAKKVNEFYKTHGSINIIQTDGTLSQDEMSLENAELIRDAAPWGQGFPVPTFSGTFRVKEARIIGKIHLKMQLAFENGTRSFSAIAFRALEPEQKVPKLNLIEVAYQLDINEFKGAKHLQLLIDHFAPV